MMPYTTRAVSVGLILLCALGAAAQAAPEPATWRYTFDKPADDWSSPGFDDSSWPSSQSPFGSAGTPGITPNTNWSKPDIWLRRQVTLPATRVDPSTLQLLVFHDE